MICQKFEDCILTTKSNGSSICQKCRKESSNFNITSQENGKKYNLINDRRCLVINFLVDGCVYYNENINKCDRVYIIDDRSAPTIIFIELKGKNNRHALEQLMSTAFRHKGITRDKRVYFRVVCSGAPNIGNDPKIAKLKKELYKEFGSVPIIRERVLSEKYSELK